MKISAATRFTQFRNQLRPVYWVSGITAAVFMALWLVTRGAA